MIPVAKFKEQSEHHVSGLTGVRMGSDMLSSSCCTGSSTTFDEDSNQDLHSEEATQQKQKLNEQLLSKSFKHHMMDDEVDSTAESTDERKGPRVLLNKMDSADSETYDLERADKKQK